MRPARIARAAIAATRARRAREAARALAAIVVLGGCRPAPPPAGRAHDGLHVVIHADRGDAAAGRAHVDDRRWLDVPADGWLDLTDVDGGLALDSVVVGSASDPSGFVASQCQRLRADRGIGTGTWLVGRAVAFTTSGGAVVRGEVVEVGGAVGVISDDDRGPVEVTEVSLEGGADEPVTTAQLGHYAYGRDADGDAVYGPLIALRAATATVATPDQQRAVITLGAVTQVQVDGVSGAPTLRCRVRARRPGRHLVRAAYSSDGFRWSASYRVVLPSSVSTAGGLATAGAEVADDAALTSVAVATRFTIEAVALATARLATVELVAGLPDDDLAPTSVWRGEVAIGGGPVVVVGEPIARDARLGWVYRGAVAEAGEDRGSEVWHVDSHGLVWHELALAPRPGDVPGPIEVVIDAAESRAVRAILPAAERAAPRAIRIPLTTSAVLYGFRRHRMLVHDAGVLADEVLYSVSNRGDRPMQVTIEEELRGYDDVTIRHQKPDGAVALRRGRWRRTVDIAPGGIAQGAIVVQYRTEPRGVR